MTGSEFDVFRRDSGLHGVSKPFGNRCGLLGYILTEESIGRVGERSSAIRQLVNHKHMVKNCAKERKMKEVEAEISGKESERTEQKRGEVSLWVSTETIYTRHTCSENRCAEIIWDISYNALVRRAPH